MWLLTLFIVCYFWGQVVAKVTNITDLVLHHWGGGREGEEGAMEREGRGQGGREGEFYFLHLYSIFPAHATAQWYSVH